MQNECGVYPLHLCVRHTGVTCQYVFLSLQVLDLVAQSNFICGTLEVALDADNPSMFMSSGSSDHNDEVMAKRYIRNQGLVRSFWGSVILKEV